jgi:4-nitrophenyl phosphatase
LPEPGGGRSHRPEADDLVAECPVVRHDQDRPPPGRGSRRSLDQVDEDRVGTPPSGMSDRDPGRHPDGAETGIGRAIEDDLDPDRGWDHRSQATDEPGRRSAPGRAVVARREVEQVVPIDQQELDASERIGRSTRHPGIVAWREGPGTDAVAYDRPMLLLVDLDGVVYRGVDPIPGVAGVLAARAATGDDVVYATNNSQVYRADYVTRLRSMGAPVEADRVISSARATAIHLATEEPQLRRVLAVGAAGLEHELRDVGLDVVTAGHAATRMSQEGLDGSDAAGHPDAVVVGLDPQLTYLRLAAAADCIRAGSRFIATNRDPVYPTERGLRPGAGSVVAALEATTGVVPLSIGKPELHLFRIALAAVGVDPSEAVVIGDGILTDIAGARAIGARSILMLTGVTTAAEADELAADARPTAIATDAAELAAALDGLA